MWIIWFIGYSFTAGLYNFQDIKGWQAIKANIGFLLWWPVALGEYVKNYLKFEGKYKND